MAFNFKILTQRQKDKVHLFPRGELDGSSAFELIDAIRRCTRRVDRIIVHTGGLKAIHPFGVEIFHRGFPHPVLGRLPVRFIGRNAHQIIPNTQER
ncbi:MAG: hypothetical protein C4530_16540 [Desulfobacteraceae bacterium]|nr:MAG: hypothetical protein C4530_16540 [Desulfobacteraceae bacterium]